MKNKISFLGNFEDPGYEGLVSVSLKIKSFLESKGVIVSFNKFNANILHIHSNGFLDGFKFSKYGNRIIYSLYSNFNTSVIGSILYYIELHTKYYDPRDKEFRVGPIIINAIFSIISPMVPLFVKRKILSKMKVVVLPNKYTYNKIKLKNAIVISLGIDVNKFIKIFGKDRKEPKKFVVAYFGHNTPLKGIPDVLGASKILKNKNIEFRLYISNYSPRIKKLIKKYNADVKVYGFVKDIVKEYNECDIIVLPYRSDVASIGVPLVLIEAMACEKTIITTNLEYIKEVVQDCAECVDAYSPKQIARTIIRLKNDSNLRTELGKKARERVVKYYNQQKMFEEYEKLYKRFSSIPSKSH